MNKNENLFDDYDQHEGLGAFFYLILATSLFVVGIGAMGIYYLVDYLINIM